MIFNLLTHNDDKTLRALSEIKGKKFQEPKQELENTPLEIFNRKQTFQKFKEVLCDPEWKCPIDPLGLQFSVATGIEFYMEMLRKENVHIEIDFPELLLVDRRMFKVVDMASMHLTMSDNVVSKQKQKVNSGKGRKAKKKAEDKAIYEAIGKEYAKDNFLNRQKKLSQASIAKAISKKIEELNKNPPCDRTICRFLDKHEGLSVSDIERMEHNPTNIANLFQKILK